MFDFIQKGKQAHHACETTSINILFLNKIILKQSGIILSSPDEYQFWSDASLLFQLVDDCSQ